MPDIIITPSSGKLEFVDNSVQVTRRHSFTMDANDGLNLDAHLSAAAISAPLNVINVTVNNSNVNYPFVLAQSGETGAKNLLMDGAGGTYNPFTNTATIDISGNSATTTLASNSTNLGGVAAASYVTLTGTQTLTNKTITGTFTGNLTGTGSWATNAVNANTATNSTQLNGQSDSYYTNIPARLGYTPVNKAGDTISGNLTVNGNFAVNGSVTAFSASNIYITSSTLTVTDNILLMNALSPYQRYAGIQMYDSGSGTVSQFLWDGEGDYFFLTGSSVNGKIITGPDGQTNLTSNFIPKATAGYKLGNSLLYDNGTNVGIGTTTPSGKLSTGATSGMKLLVYDNAATGVYTGLGQDLAEGNSTDLFAHSVSNLGFITFGKIGTNGTTYTEWARFNTSGNLGIGTTSPNTKLAVNGVSSFGPSSKLSMIGLDINSSGTPTYIKIVTTIPVASPSADFTVNIKGFVYGAVRNADISISWHYYLSTFYNPIAKSSGGWAPTIRLSAENGFVAIVLSSPGYWPKFYVESMYSSAYTNQYASGWSWTDADANGNPIVNVPYASNFGNGFVMLTDGNVGIGTTGPGAKLDVNGDIYVRSGYGLYSNIIGSYTGDLTFYTGGSEKMRILSSGGNVGVGTTSPTTKLHVVGVISGSSFSGAGTGLTGTASGLSIGGNAANITAYTINQNLGTANTPSFAGATINGQLQVNNATPTSILRIFSGGSTAWNIGVGDSSGTNFNITADFGSILINKSTGNIWISGSGINNTVLHSNSTLTAGNLSGTIPSGVLGNSTHYVGTTAIALNRGSASQTLTGVSIDGNAATVGTLSINTSGRNDVANQIVRTDSNGYIQAGWINTTSGDQGTSAIDRVYASYDGYIRYYTPANFRTVLDVPTRGGSGASGTWGINVTGTAAGETLSTVTGRGNGTGTQIIVATAAGQAMYIGRQAGAGYSYGSAGIFTALSDNPNGGSNIFYQGYISSSASTPGGILTYSVRADGQIYTTMNTATGIANNSFSVAKTVLGTIHIANGSGTSGNNRQAAITFQGDSATEAQAGIYVSNNNSSGTAMGFATTDSYGTGPQLFMTATNAGVVNFSRARPTYAGNALVDVAGGQTIAGITYFSNGESMNVYGIRGRFTNEYLHLYNKVGVGHPGGWGQGEGNTPSQGLSTYGGISIAYGTNATSIFYGNVGVGTTSVSARVESYYSSNAITFNYLATNLNNNSPIPVYGFDVTNGSGETRSIKAGIGYERHLTNGRGTLHFYNDSTNDTQSLSGNRTSAGDIKMSIDNDGNVGIGTPTPTYKLQVQGSFYVNSTAYINGALTVDDNIIVTAGNDFGIYDSDGTGAYWQYMDSGIAYLRIDDGGSANGKLNINNGLLYVGASGGNVGINTTGANSRLHIYDNSDVWHFRLGGASGELRMGGQNNSGAVIQAYTPAGAVRDLYLQRDGGAIGIGTNSPLANCLATFKSSNTGRVAITDGTTTANMWPTGGNFYISTETASDLVIITNATERMRILSGGNVGIGTSNPGRKLDVEGIVRTRGASGTGGFEISAASSGTAKWRIEWDSASDSLDFNWVG